MSPVFLNLSFIQGLTSLRYFEIKDFTYSRNLRVKKRTILFSNVTAMSNSFHQCFEMLKCLFQSRKLTLKIVDINSGIKPYKKTKKIDTK